MSARAATAEATGAPEEIGAPARVHWARRAGRIVQGLVLGACLPLAVSELLRIAGDISPFKYQGF